MKIGFSYQPLLLPLDIEMGGYAVEGRTVLNQHDSIQVKVIYAEYEQQRFLLVNYDLVGVDHLLVEPIKHFSAQQAICPTNVFVTATHTHSGPGGILDTASDWLKSSEPVFKKVNKQLVENILKHTYPVIQEAIMTAQETQIRMGQTILEEIGKNRNHPEIGGLDDLLVVELTTTDKRCLISLFACHPTILNPSNRSYSADLPGSINTYAQSEGYDFVIFLNGACGDISTRYTRELSGMNEVQRMGQLFWHKIRSLLPELNTKSINFFNLSHADCTLLLKTFDSPQRAFSIVKSMEKVLDEACSSDLSRSALRKIESDYEGAVVNYHHAVAPIHQDKINLSIPILQLNERFFVFVPGELFSELIQSYELEKIHFICYANGYLGYLADKRSYEEGCYEAYASPFESGQAEKLVAEIFNKIEKIKGDAR